MSHEPDDLIALPSMPWNERPLELPLDIEECRTAIWRAKGNITKAAEILKITSGRLRRFVQSSPRLTMELNESREQLADRAEEIVAEALEDVDDPQRQDQMARYVLSSQGKARGWGNGNGGGVKINNNGGTIHVSWGDGSAITQNEPKVIEHEHS